MIGVRRVAGTLTIEMEGNCLHVKIQGCTKPLAKFCEQER